MTDRRQPSHPPSDPRLSLTGRRPDFVPQDRPVRFQLVAASLLGLALLATGLYVWQRPHLADAKGADDAESPVEAPSDASAELPSVDAGPAPVTLTEARIVGCHDRGPKKTPPDECDHLGPIEHALAAAVEHSVSCMPSGAAGGTIEYLADVSFSRRRVRVVLPRAGRSVRDRKVLVACAGAVREALQSVALDGVAHQHARYGIAVTATYRGVNATDHH